MHTLAAFALSSAIANRGAEMERKWPGRSALLILCLGLVQCTASTTTSPGVPTAFATVRLLLTGSGDATFGTGGIVTTAVDPTLNGFATALAIQPDSKIVVAGSNGLAGQGQIALVRYNSDGSLDKTTFGTSSLVPGTVNTSLGSPASASAIAIDPSSGNKIVVGALLFSTAAGGAVSTSMTVLRYSNIDGSLDQTFNTTGIATATPVGAGLVDDSCAILLQSGKVVVAAATQDGKLVLARYTSAGALDTTFGTSVTTPGTTVTPLTPPASNPTHTSPAMAAQSDGRIIVVTRSGDDQAVLRYSVDGVQDTGFGSVPGGIVVTPVGSGVNYANAVAIQATGVGVSTSLDKIFVAGHANVSETTSDISVVRYNADGTIDTTFGSGGIVTTDIFFQFDNAFGIALQDVSPAEPKIVVVGNTGIGGFSQTAVLRYTSLGAPDISFGASASGLVLVPVVGPSSFASGNAIAIQAGAIVVTGFD
jgi:uncharacterized delta-60 repeat protein